jgi:hypothetical protein
MWKIAAIVFAAGWLLAIVVMWVLRPIVHRRRERMHGIAGTQDIVMWCSLVGLVCMIGTMVSLAVWLSSP